MSPLRGHLDGRAALAALAALTALASDHPARAAAVGGARLSVVRSPRALQCPDDEALAARVRALRPGRGEAAAETRIEVVIDHEGEQGLRARVSLHGARQGQRELQADGPGCEGLAEALAVSLALLLDEQAAPPPTAPTPAGSANPPPVAPVASPALPPTAPATGSSPPPTAPAPSSPRLAPPASSPVLPRGLLALHLGGALVIALPQSVAPALDAGLRLAPRSPVLGGARFTWTPSQRRDFAGGEVEVSLWRLSLDLCTRATEGAEARLDLCALVSAGSLRGQGRGFAPDRQTSRPFYALGVSALARGPLTGWLAWSARLSPLVALRRERFVVDQQGVGFDQSRLGGELVVGLEALIL